MALKQHTSWHPSVSIESLLRSISNMEVGALAMLNIPDFEQAEKEVLEMKELGFEYIPSARCDNRKENGQCAGHSTWVQEAEVYEATPHVVSER